MKEADRQTRNRSRLQECYPTFRTRVALVIADLQAQGFRPRMQDAWRSPEDEVAAFDAGHSHVMFGFHNVTGPDGKPAALAADLLDDDHPLNPARDYLLALARTARKYGLATGILWGLPDGLRMGLDAALTQGTAWTGKVGWDPDHVEVTGITIPQAKAGQRPPPYEDV